MNPKVGDWIAYVTEGMIRYGCILYIRKEMLYGVSYCTNSGIVLESQIVEIRSNPESNPKSNPKSES